MKTYRTKDGDHTMPEEEKFYLIRNGKVDRSYKGTLKQCTSRKKDFESKGETVELIPVEEARFS